METGDGGAAWVFLRRVEAYLAAWRANGAAAGASAAQEPGPFPIALEWSSDGWMRSQVRRWIPKATAMVEGGWRELVPRTVPED